MSDIVLVILIYAFGFWLMWIRPREWTPINEALPENGNLVIAVCAQPGDDFEIERKYFFDRWFVDPVDGNEYPTMFSEIRAWKYA